jgi:hypothetical protein
MVATYKLNIPAPVSKDSRAFAEALKVCSAASIYGVPVDFAKGNELSLSISVLKIGLLIE